MRLANPRIDISPLVTFSNWDELAAARGRSPSAGAGATATAVEGMMLKRRDSPYLPGGQRVCVGMKRDPFTVDARIDVWRNEGMANVRHIILITRLVSGLKSSITTSCPGGKAYFGFTIRTSPNRSFIRHNTVVDSPG